MFPAVFRGFLSSFPRHRMPAFLCSVPLPVSRPLFLFCRMLSGLFVCLFPGIGCRLSSFCSRVFSPALFLCPVPRGIPRLFFFFSPASDAGVLRFVRGSLAPRCFFVLFSAVFRGFLSSFPRHRMPVFFPLYGEVGSSLLRFNPATISRPLRTSTSRLFFVLFAGL